MVLKGGPRARLAGVVGSLALQACHVLVVPAPGAWRVRVAAEADVRRRGWGLAQSPADADLLLVCGSPGPVLAACVDRVWEQMPGPRARATAGTVADVAGMLDAAAAELADPVVQRDRARASRAGEGDPAGRGAHQGAHHRGHDHGEMAPGGISLAGGAEDRDGLEMDVLHVPLGPVLPHWPAGLVLHITLAGDVVTEAEPELCDPGSGRPQQAGAAERAARRCDHAADVLALAGWADAATRAGVLRDALLEWSPPGADGGVSAGSTDEAGSTGEGAWRDLAHLHRRVGRARLLRRTLRGLGRAPAHVGGHAPTPDIYDRLLHLLAPQDPPQTHRWPGLGDVPTLVRGSNLATCRLVVASLALDDERDAAGAGVRVR